MTLIWFFALTQILFLQKDEAKVISCSLPDGSPPFLSPPSVMWCENRVSAASLRYPSLCYRLPGEPDCSQVSWSAGLLVCVCVRGKIIQTWLKRHTFPLLLSPQWDRVWTRSWIRWSNFSCAAASDVLQIQSWQCRSAASTSTSTSHLQSITNLKVLAVHGKMWNIIGQTCQTSSHTDSSFIQPSDLKLVYNRAEIESTTQECF